MSGIEPKLKIGFMYPITPAHPRFFFRLLGFIFVRHFPVADARDASANELFRPTCLNFFRPSDNLKTILPNQLQSTFELGARILVQPNKRESLQTSF
jgi:hypothetical protein